MDNPNGAVLFGSQGTSFPSATAAYNAIRASGTADYNSWQYMHRRWYYKQSYPTAGASSLTFFSNPAGVGGATIDTTNIPQSNGFGNQYVIIHNIECNFYIKTWNILSWAGTDVSTLVSDLLAGFPWGGVLQLSIGNRLYAQTPMPMLYMPPGNGQAQLYDRGLETLTLTEGTPNLIATSISAAPYVEFEGWENIYELDPYIGLIPRENFQLTIDFPTGLIPIIGTTIANNDTNPFYLVVTLDTITFRALQG